MSARGIFEALPGRWHLERRLEPGLGTMSGTATFTRVAPRLLRLDEEGTLRLTSGYEGPATRSYDYRLVEDGADGGIDVCFAEERRAGQILHELRFSGTDAICAVHHCAPDVYTGTYAFRPPGEIVVTIEVTGPHKAYTTVTRLSRAAAGPRPPSRRRRP